jgi:tetratricopeptide (TPR) repeat protein
MVTASPPYRAVQRRLILRDSLVFLVLTLIVVALFGITLFLFKSFSTHRADLAKRWYQRGKQELAAHQPVQAINDLRNALGFDPSNPAYEFALAQALDQAGQLDESFAYFSNLQDAEPGSGPLNLELARLSVRKGVIADALRYYRAAIYGNWEDDALKNRRAVRLELIQSMLDHGQLNAARTEVLIASEDAGDDPDTLPRLASLMSEAREYTLALELYQKTLAANPNDAALHEGAGHAAFSLGHYGSAQKYFQQAADHLHGELPAGRRAELDLSGRIVNLFPAPNLPAAEHAERIQRLAAIVPNLLSDCRSQIKSRGGDQSAMDELDELDRTWADQTKKPAPNFRRDRDAQNALLNLVYRIAVQTAQSCPASTGDDLVLQMIAKSPETILQ